MRYIVSTSLRILGVITMLILFAGPLQADPVVILHPPLTPPTRTFNFMQLNRPDRAIPFLADAQGSVTVTFVNGTGLRVDCLDIRVMPAQGQSLTGSDLTGLFRDPTTIIGTDQVLIFDPVAGFPGMTNGQSFTFTVTGLIPFSTITVTPTVLGCVNQDGTRAVERCPLEPAEPTTILLLCTGLAGVAIKTRKKLKSRKSGQGRE